MRYLISRSLLFCILLAAQIGFAADHTITLSAADENLLTWAANRASDLNAVPPVVVNETQVLNRVVNKGMSELANERVATQNERLWNKFQALSPGDKQKVLQVIGSLDQ